MLKVIYFEQRRLDEVFFMCGFSMVAALKGCFSGFLESNGITRLVVFGVFKIDQLYVGLS